jgi:hypothetical protein
LVNTNIPKIKLKGDSKMRLNYSVLKRNILRVCKQTNPNSLEFTVSTTKLNNSVKDCGLTFLFNDYKSEQVTGSNIPLIGEYFKKDKLSWFNRARHFAILSFVVTEDLDEVGLEIIERLSDKNRADDPAYDRVADVAKILADYPCYNAIIVSYRSEDPNKIGKNSYAILVRANINAILKEQEDYYHDDSEDDTDENNDGE